MFQGEDVNLVGDFTGNWKEPLKAKHQGGTRHEVEVKLPQGKYVCFFYRNSLYSKSIIFPSQPSV